MGNIFRWDSPLMRVMMLITNLLCLNVLWLVCCLPVITAGAATTALYYVIFQYITKQDDGVVKPFFKAFKENFKNVTPVWVLHLMIGAALGAEAFYLTQGAQLWLRLAFGVLLVVYAGISAYLYPILARYNTTRKQAVFNSFALSTRHLLTTACLVILNSVPLVMILFLPEIFWKTVFLWTLGGFSLIAYLCGRMLMPVLRKYEPQSDADGEEREDHHGK